MFSFTKDSKSSLKLSHDDSRAQAIRSLQSLKEESSLENQVWIKSIWKDLQEDLSLDFVSLGLL